MSKELSREPNLQRLIDLIRRLRSPDGCPWDREQTTSSVRAYLLEEAHEVADALDRNDHQDLPAEIGDLLFQLCFLAELAAEEGLFSIADVIDQVHDKMIERHPHVFGDTPAEEKPETAEQVAQAWERRKVGKRKPAWEAPVRRSLLDGLPKSLPALTAAHRMSQKAAGVGFDWENHGQVFSKVEEELGELRNAISEIKSSEQNRSGRLGPEGSASQGAASNERSLSTKPRGASVVEELGDLLFALSSLSRHLGVDPEHALAKANLKFRRRFAHIEERLGERLEEAPDERLRSRMEELWQEAKELER